MTSKRIRIDSVPEGTIAVTSPFDAAFVGRARALGGTWDRERGAWIFDASAEEPVRVALREVYGTDGSEADGGAEATTLYVYAPRRVWADRAPLRIGTITLARAFGRDSGARLGGGVAHLAGPAPKSGGSVKNWDTRVEEGCLLAVYNVPRAEAERALESAAPFAARLGDPTERAAEVLDSLRPTTTIHAEA